MGFKGSLRPTLQLSINSINFGSTYRYLRRKKNSNLLLTCLTPTGDSCSTTFCGPKINNILCDSWGTDCFLWHHVIHREIFLGRPVWIRQCSVFSLWGSSDLPDSRVAISPSNKGQIVGKLVVNVTRLWLADRRSHQRCRTEAAPFSYPQEKCYQLPQRCRLFTCIIFPWEI